MVSLSHAPSQPAAGSREDSTYQTYQSLDKRLAAAIMTIAIITIAIITVAIITIAIITTAIITIAIITLAIINTCY